MVEFVPEPGQVGASSDTGPGTFGQIGIGVGSMLSEAGIASATAGVQKLMESAKSTKSGGFAINEEGANAYIKAFRDFEDQLGDLRRTVERAGQSPQLGRSDYAQKVAAHTQSMATGLDQSFSLALDQLGVVVTQARQAFEEAKKHYSEMEDEAVQTFRSVQD